MSEKTQENIKFCISVFMVTHLFMWIMMGLSWYLGKPWRNESFLLPMGISFALVFMLWVAYTAKASWVAMVHTIGYVLYAAGFAAVLNIFINGAWNQSPWMSGLSVWSVVISLPVMISHKHRTEVIAEIKPKRHAAVS